MNPLSANLAKELSEYLDHLAKHDRQPTEFAIRNYIEGWLSNSGAQIIKASDLVGSKN